MFIAYDDKKRKWNSLTGVEHKHNSMAEYPLGINEEGVKRRLLEVPGMMEEMMYGDKRKRPKECSLNLVN